jgi:hypothetical protein
MTLGAIDAVLRRWAETGEAAGGRYFHTTDLVITPRPGITAMIEAINGLVQEEEIGNACRIISGVIEQDPMADMGVTERLTTLTSDRSATQHSSPQLTAASSRTNR